MPGVALARAPNAAARAYAASVRGVAIGAYLLRRRRASLRCGEETAPLARTAAADLGSAGRVGPRPRKIPTNAAPHLRQNGDRVAGVPFNPRTRRTHPEVVGYYDRAEWEFGGEQHVTEFTMVGQSAVDCDVFRPARDDEPDTVLE